MNYSCDYGMPSMAQVPGMGFPAQGTAGQFIPGQSMNPMDQNLRSQFPVGMGYVPMQNWETPYPMDQAFRRGTIFPSLDLPFTAGRWR